MPLLAYGVSSRARRRYTRAIVDGWREREARVYIHIHVRARGTNLSARQFIARPSTITPPLVCEGREVGEEHAQGESAPHAVSRTGGRRTGK